MAGNKKATEKDVLNELFNLKRKNFTSNFNATSRMKRQQVLASRTNPPAVGHYRPKNEVVQSKYTREVDISKGPDRFRAKIPRKGDKEVSRSQIC